MNHEHFLDLAFQEARKAAAKDEVPVGAVIVRDGKIIAKAHNLKESKSDATAHAEMIAIRKASKKIGDWRLNECTLYVTLKPCEMCAAALVHARIGKVYFGAEETRSEMITHRYEMEYLEVIKCSSILSDYFRAKRKKKK